MAVARILYDSIYDALKACPVVKTVADYNGQYLDSEIESYNLVKYPAAYVEMGTVNWEKSMNKFQEIGIDPQTGIAEVKVHVVYHTLKGFTKEVKDSYFNVIDSVTSYLQKLQSGNNDGGSFTTLLRVDEEYGIESDNLRYAILTFETRVTDVFEIEENKYIDKIISINVITDMI